MTGWDLLPSHHVFQGCGLISIVGRPLLREHTVLLQSRRCVLLRDEIVNTAQLGQRDMPAQRA
jgi:hypothetical protein